MIYIFREQSNGDLKCVSKRKSWIKGQRTATLIKILQGWGEHSVFHVVKARAMNHAISIIRNHQKPQSIEIDISLQQYGEYIETMIINEELENDEYDK